MIQFECTCGRMLQAPEANAGQDAKCPACGAIVPIPSYSDRPPPPAPVPVMAEEEDDRPRRRGSRFDEPPKKAGWSTGLIIGLALGGVLLCCAGPVGLLIFAVGKVRTAAKRMQESNNLKLVGVAMYNHHSAYEDFPFGFKTRNGKPGLSWRVAILPYIEQENLYKQFHLDEPWDSPHNKRLLPMIPKVYLRPGEMPTPEGLTHYRLVVGKGTAFDQTFPEVLRRNPPFGLQGGLRVPEIQDGLSNTLSVVTTEKGVPWTKPDEFDIDAGPILPRLNKEFGGANVLFGDGSVRLLTSKSEQNVRAMMTARGGEVITPD